MKECCDVGGSQPNRWLCKSSYRYCNHPGKVNLISLKSKFQSYVLVKQGSIRYIYKKFLLLLYISYMWILSYISLLVCYGIYLILICHLVSVLVPDFNIKRQLKVAIAICVVTVFL
jgi:hypothetical protein